MDESSTGGMGDPWRAATRRNRRTVAGYEQDAANYAEVVGTEPNPASAAAMQRLADVLDVPAQVLELGSGTGHDADFLETLGPSVRRTDVAEAFLQLQRQRGRHAERLDVLTDDLGGPHDAVMALAVLMHIDRIQLPAVLGRIHDAIRPGGHFLVMMRDGEGTEVTDRFHTTLWLRDDLEDAYAAAGFRPVWHQFHVGRHEQQWNTHLLQRA